MTTAEIDSPPGTTLAEVYDIYVSLAHSDVAHLTPTERMVTVNRRRRACFCVSKLEGRDADWQEAGTRRQAFYNDLPPGDYRFRVTARHRDGAWNEAGAMLSFSVAPTWYQTTWFRVLSVISVVALLWFLYGLRVWQIERSQEALQHAQAALADMSKIASLGEMAAAIAHEVNQPLAAIRANASTCQRFLRAGQPDIQEARDAAGRIVSDVGRATEVIQRVRQLFSRSGATKALLDINEAIDEAVTLTRARVQKNGGVVRTELAEGIPMVLGDRIQLEQVVANLVANRQRR